MKRFQSSKRNSKDMSPQLVVLMVALFGLLPVVFVVIGLTTGLNAWSLHKYGLRAEGVVIDVKRSTSDDGDTYCSVVRFTDRAGVEYVFTNNVCSSSPMQRHGAYVSVLFDPEKPDKAMVDNGKSDWIIPIVFTLLGSIFCLIFTRGVLSSVFKELAKNTFHRSKTGSWAKKRGQ